MDCITFTSMEYEYEGYIPCIRLNASYRRKDYYMQETTDLQDLIILL